MATYSPNSVALLSIFNEGSQNKERFIGVRIDGKEDSFRKMPVSRGSVRPSVLFCANHIISKVLRRRLRGKRATRALNWGVRRRRFNRHGEWKMKTAGKLLILACCAAFVVYDALFQTPGQITRWHLFYKSDFAAQYRAAQ
jgi:hypothetical protein